MSNNKIIIVLGPTASGKSDLAVDIARKFNGEVISADSRQVYKGLNIGTGKITKREMRGVPHHLLDVVKPQTIFDVIKFKKLAEKKIEEIIKKGKVPIICGGTGFYIQAIVNNPITTGAIPDKKLRKKLEKLSAEKLFQKLKKLDSKKAKNIDSKNPRRLIRAIEIALGPTTKYLQPATRTEQIYEFFQIGIKTDKEVSKERIRIRLLKRMKQGMVAEAQKIHKEGLSWKRMDSLGLEYRYLAKYLKKEISKEEMIELLNIKIRQYSKRQRTWFKRDKSIKWFELKETKKIKKEVERFLK